MSNDTTVDLLCGLCGRKKHLVCQLYAPTDVSRTLYVFCCPTEQCSSQGDAWSVIRDQSPFPQSGKDVVVDTIDDDVELIMNTMGDPNLDLNPSLSHITASSISPPQPPSSHTVTPKNKLEWDNLLDDDEDDDFAALLASRDAKLATQSSSQSKAQNKKSSVSSSSKCGNNQDGKNANKCKKSAQPTIPSSSGASSAVSTYPSWPSYVIHDIEEDITALQGSGGVDGSSDQDHIEHLVQQYVTSLQQDEHKTNSDSTGKGGDNNKDIDEYGIDVVAKMCKQSLDRSVGSAGISSAKGVRDGYDSSDSEAEEIQRASERLYSMNSQGAGDGTKPAGGTTLSRAERRQKKVYESYFMRRVSLYPHQVVRYAYGGQPLWCTFFSIGASAGPSENSTSSSSCSEASSYSPKAAVPPCGGCGSARVFECQLMPNAIRYINVATGGTAIPNATSSSSTTDGVMGLDFGVVALYSCPISCEGSIHEYAVVLPSLV